jgi:hypothetical protein
MFEESEVLCASSAYDEKFYFNERYSGLPQTIQDELKILCVLFTSEVGGILSLEFEEDGELLFRVSADEDDILYDEIGSALKIKSIQATKRELLESLELYYQTFFLNKEN